MRRNFTILKTVFVNSFFTGYIIFSLISLQNCKYSRDESTSEKLVQEKHKIAKLMMNEFSAEMFDCNAKSILNKTIILDTLLIGISRRGSEYHLNAEVFTSCGKKHFAKLLCSKEIVKQFEASKTNRAYIAAKITRIDNSEIYADTDTLDGKRSELALGSSILLSGECISMNELPTVLN